MCTKDTAGFTFLLFIKTEYSVDTKISREHNKQTLPIYIKNGKESKITLAKV